MKYVAFTVVLSLLSTITVAQVVTRTFNLPDNSNSYILTVEPKPDGSKIISVKRSDGSVFIQPVNLNPFTYAQFHAALLDSLFGDQKKKHPQDSVETINKQIADETKLLFFETVANSLISPDDVGPIAGTVTVNPSVQFYRKENEFITEDQKRRLLSRLSRKLENKTIRSFKKSSTSQQVYKSASEKDSIVHIKRSAISRNVKIQRIGLSIKHLNDSSKSSLLRDTIHYKIKYVEMEILEGFLENISATIKDGNTFRVFTNQFGIGFASKNNFNNLYKYWLLEKGKPYDEALKINLGELVHYEIHHEPGLRDYSPQDNRYFFDTTNTPSILRKDATKRLLEARVYSDFVGLDENNPNGLVQIEVAKRINTNTNRALAFRKQWWFNDGFRFILGSGVGMFQYVIPVVTLSKFEQHNRNLLVRHNRDSIDYFPTTHPMSLTVNGKPISRDTTIYTPFAKGQYLTALELIRYQNFSAGLDFNLLYSENVGGKFNFYIDGGIRFGRTAVRDSITKINSFTNAFGGIERQAVTTGQVNDFGVNTFQIYPEIRMQWLPDERFGITLTRRWTYFSLLNGDLESRDLNQGSSNNFIASARPPDFNKSTRWLGTWELSAFLKASNNGKLFFRYRLFNELGNTKYNFYQAQVGYSFYLLGNQKASQSGSSN